MATTANMQDLARRIARQEAQLAALRRRLEFRVARLQRRREGLQAELRTIEAQIDAAGGDTVNEKLPAAPLSPALKPAARPTPKLPADLSLADFLIGLVREGNGKPVLMATLKEEAVRRGFPSKSANFPRMLEKRTYDLCQRGMLRRLSKKRGFVLAGAANGSEAPPKAQAKAPSGRGRRSGRVPLRIVLLNLLKNAGRTMSVEELADQAIKGGYQTTSKNLKDSIWVAAGKMPELENDPEGGYRLKKRK